MRSHTPRLKALQCTTQHSNTHTHLERAVRLLTYLLTYLLTKDLHGQTGTDVCVVPWRSDCYAVTEARST